MNILETLSMKEMEDMRLEKKAQFKLLKDSAIKTDSEVKKILELDKQIEVIEFYMKKRSMTFK